MPDILVPGRRTGKCLWPLRSSPDEWQQATRQPRDDVGDDKARERP
jgi:hypothetical protein